MAAKKAGDKATANALKLVVNTTYGAMLNQFNDLYDPLMGRSVCISGQLYLLELAVHLHRDIKELKIIQLNTDGIMVECDKKYLDKVNEICGEWQKRTGFSLEEDKVIKIAQKDVNNYIEVQVDGTSKAKGGYLVRGISTVGSFNINNNAVIVAEALKENFVNGIAPEDTINACEDIFKFQMIAKASSKYKEAYQIVDKQKVSIQKTNRVYATTNKKLGTLYKVKEDGATAKIESLPEHCIIDNENQLSIKDIDKSFYIELAKKRIDDFLGIKLEKKVRKKNMATKKTTEETTAIDFTKLNVYQKLIKAREMFLSSDVQKTGKNMHLSFKYFELDDIVPTATRIFNEIGLISVVNFTDHTAVLTIIDTDKPEDNIDFASPFNQISPIISKEGRAATNEMQALGSSITYMRRYLYMMALDICESDGIEANIGKDNTQATTNNVKKAPATPVERAEIKDNLTAPTENASELQIKGLRNVLQKLREAHPDKNELVNKISVETQGFTIISKADCEKLIEKISAMLEA
jgi:DNA polymerase elongation subunit (family B)